MDAETTTPGSRLTEWLDGPNGEKRTDFAKGISATRMAVRRYEQGRMPTQPFLDRIVIRTKGGVTANAWLGKEAADVVAQRQSGA